MRKLLMASILALLTVFFTTLSTYANTDIRVTINGEEVAFDGQAPVIVGGRTLVPVRGVFEELGFDVGWNGEARQATLTRSDFTVVLTIGSATFTTNGINHALDVPAQIIGGSTMLPIRAVLESVGYYLDWDGGTRTVIISSTPIQEQSVPTALVGFGSPVTLQEAQRRPGLYIKDGDGFIHVSPQFTGRVSNSHVNIASGARMDTIGTTRFLFDSEVNAILLDPTFQIPQIPNDAQLVLIGITSINMHEIILGGYAIPSIATLREDAQMNDTITIGTIFQAETLNEGPPALYVNRMFYTGGRNFLTGGASPPRLVGLLTGSLNEEFTFGRWQGTNWVEYTLTANSKFFTYPSSAQRRANYHANFEVVRTLNGYFEIDFLIPPHGYFFISSDRIVEFVGPQFPSTQPPPTAPNFAGNWRGTGDGAHLARHTNLPFVDLNITIISDNQMQVTGQLVDFGWNRTNIQIDEIVTFRSGPQISIDIPVQSFQANLVNMSNMVRLRINQNGTGSLDIMVGGAVNSTIALTRE